MNKVQRVFLIVLDGLGVGELPDAHLFGDTGSNTLGNTARALGGLTLPNFEKLGLGKIIEVPGLSNQVPGKAYGKMAEKSRGKDTTTGHWEMAGLVLEAPFPVFPTGFPATIMQQFAERTGRATLANIPASGTAVIDEFGAAHLDTGALIVYTSADSVFQIAAHEELVPLKQLYDYCEIAREILQGDYGVGRVIARPFRGSPGQFYRTAGRKDFSLPPVQPTILEKLKAADYTVYGVGKIEDIFCSRGLTASNHTHNNAETLAFVSELLTKDFTGLVFANCIDFDMEYGHRNDVVGFGKALEAFDQWLGPNLAKLRAGDLLILTGDHGCDPTTSSTDHSREYTPLLITGPEVGSDLSLGIRESFADLAATLAVWFGLEPWLVGQDFAALIKQGSPSK